MRITEQARIERPPEQVWAAITDLSSHKVWRPALVEFRQVSEGPLGVGSSIREVLRWRGREIVIDDVVTSLEAPRRFAIRGGWNAADFELELRLEPAGDRVTLVTFDWSLYPRSPLLRLAAPFLAGSMRRATAEEAALLKDYVERDAGAKR
jgi:carbon monoxide dehydrogenase subunit G